MKYSLRAGLVTLWVLVLLISLGLGAVITSLFRQGVDAQVQQAASRATTACEAIDHRFDQYLTGFGQRPESLADERVRRELTFLVDVVLSQYPGIEGGLWNERDGFVVYAFPTYEGTAPKTDVPEAERPRIALVTRKALAARAHETSRYDGTRESVILHACPLFPDGGAAAWTMLRVPVGAGTAYQNLLLGLGGLFVLALISGLWLFLLLRRWSRRVDDLAGAIERYPIDELPRLPDTGEQGLDRIVAAINHLSRRLAAAQDHSATLSKQLSQADRLAALGRMAAVLAHEIRNPLGTIRLKAENALGDTLERQQQAWDAVLQQVTRLDVLLQRLMAIVQPLDLHPEPVLLDGWLRERVDQFREMTDQRGLVVRCSAPDTKAVFDAASLGRALDNLILNAVQHTPAHGSINIAATQENGNLRLTIEDSGSGVAEDLREHVFEPFTTTRADGSGLGLAIVREIVEAHGGHVRYQDGTHGARFELELPWRTS